MKLIMIALISCIIGNTYARPRPMPRIVHRPPIRHHHHHHRHHLTPYVVGALTGLAITRAITSPALIVVQQPIVVRPTKTVVWEDGHYEDQVQANGTIVRIWVPGRYVERIITQ